MAKKKTTMRILARLGAGACVLFALAPSVPGQSAPPLLHSIGDPSNVEQFQLELINRARMYPQLEGRILRKIDDTASQLEYDYFRVRMDEMEDELSEQLPMPPLTFSAELSIMALSHALDMRDNQFQGHVGSDGATIRDRADAAGYSDWVAVGENVFSYADTPAHAHASFEVDWGEGPGGMQVGRPHRVNIHSAEFTEVGIAQVPGDGPEVGPQIVAQEFGRREDGPAFITGVAYFDLNGNGFYDIGEGIGGIAVTVDGGRHFAVTTPSGGYAVPVGEDGEYRVTFRGIDMESVKTAVVANGENVKVDYRPAFAPAKVSGPRLGVAGVSLPYTTTRIPGALTHEVLACRTSDSPAAEGAELDSSSWIVAQDDDYAVRQSAIVAGGAFAFHLAHPDAGSRSQSITFDRIFIPGANGELVFRSRLGYADTAQVARVRISANEGQTWTSVWEQTGSGDAGEKFFGRHAASLADFAGQMIQLRFEYFIGAGYVFEGAGEGYGWYFDDIGFRDTEEVLQSRTTPFEGGEELEFPSPEEGSVKLYARGRTAGGVLPVSRPLEVVSTPNSFSGWMRRKFRSRPGTSARLPSRRSDTDGDGLTLFEEYALEWHGADPGISNASVLPQPREFGNTLVLDYKADRGRSDVALVPEVSLDGGESWVAADDPNAPEALKDRVINWSQEQKSTVEDRRVSVTRSAGYHVLLRLGIRDLLEEEEGEEEDENRVAVE